MITELYRKHAITLSLIGLIIGAIFLVLSTLGLFLNSMDFVKNNEALQDFFDYLGNYIYWLFMLMITLTIACGWIFFDMMIKRQKFNDLIKTSSKATFVRNQNELEELAWKLGPRYMEILNERKRKFRIRN